MAGVEHDFTRGWSEVMVRAHEHTIQLCQDHAWMHYAAETLYIRLYWVLAVPTALLNVVVGSVGLVSIGEIIHQPLWYLLLALFILNIALGFLNGVNALLEPNATARKHRENATEFVKLGRWLRQQLNMDIQERDPCGDVTREAAVQYDTLLANSAYVPQHIVNRLVRILSDTVAVPEQVMDGSFTRTLYTPHYNVDFDLWRSFTDFDSHAGLNIDVLEPEDGAV